MLSKKVQMGCQNATVHLPKSVQVVGDRSGEADALSVPASWKARFLRCAISGYLQRATR